MWDICERYPTFTEIIILFLKSIRTQTVSSMNILVRFGWRGKKTHYRVVDIWIGLTFDWIRASRKFGLRRGTIFMWATTEIHGNCEFEGYFQKAGNGNGYLILFCKMQVMAHYFMPLQIFFSSSQKIALCWTREAVMGW
jgi:hypothetical protein